MTTYGARPVKARVRRTNAQLAALDDAIITAVEADHPVTLRGVFYRVMSAGAVEKSETGYKAVGRELLKLRRAGIVPYPHITDGTRFITKPPSFQDVDKMLEDAAASYRRALWHDQGVNVHMYTEKDAISGVVLPVTQQWDVPLGVLRGYSSESFCYSVAESIKHNPEHPTFIYQLGDHDPSGVNAWQDFQIKVLDFVDGAADVTFDRIAVTPPQIVEMQLPTRPTKLTDTRAARFVGESVEVDAIPAPVLRTLVQDAIESHIDPQALELTRMVEREERDGLYALLDLDSE